MNAAGQGVARDDAEAIRWYRKSAEQGYATGQNGLGMMYLLGRGVSKDEAEAAIDSPGRRAGRRDGRVQLGRAV